MTETGPAPAADAAGEIPPTGHAGADAAATRLAEVDEAPLDQHVGVYEDVHRQLQDALADVDDA